MLRYFTTFDRPKPVARGGALRAVYDAAATGWQDGISKLGFLTAYAEVMAHTPEPAPDARVLDVGTGTGAFATAWVARHGRPGALTLTDISPAMLDAAATRLAPARTVATPLGAHVPDLPPQDVVLCAHVIEHLDDPLEALQWLHDRLTPGGTLVMAISKPHWCTALVRWRWGNAAFEPEHAAHMLHEAGFEDVTAYPFSAGPPSRLSHGYVARRA
ncbi:class I SAM-dependent methyltransferase [uncultured Tateyamaria sp.]|uniref:class I SAM-dependent methyltransferase n=1 Tax=uncultured Tateyamaria sp. TaxID=455651 RepID=UPI002611A03E|nr:class I SAM-dependent methyltransferase [uncultured Tateyamaria sp.]